MRRSSIFWGGVLILIGIFLLLDNLGLLAVLGVSVWGLIWPAFLILLGLWFLWGTVFRRPVTDEQVSIPSQGAEAARIRLDHGAGRLEITAGAHEGNLLEGTFAGGLDYRAKLNENTLQVDLRPPPGNFMFFPFWWGSNYGYRWDLALNRNIFLDLNLNAGANEARLDFSDLLLKNLQLQTGASSTELTLPSHAGYTHAEVKTGVASVVIRVPDSVAARIQSSGGLSEVKVDSNRFLRSGNRYESSNYDTSENKLDLFIEVGVGSVKVINL